MPGVAVLPQGVGYGVVLGVGSLFAVLMLAVTWLFRRYSDEQSDVSEASAEDFVSASQSVKPGLIAAGIVSAWTWAATLLTSSAVGYRFGISGPWWYAAGASVQVMLFAMNAARLKRNFPTAHTYLECISARWGKVAHFTFMFFGLATNVIVSSMLILGGSAAVADLTGINTLAACFLIPVSVCVFVFFGGIRSALFGDFVHTTILLVLILVFMFTAYVTSPKIGSPRAMYDLLQEAAARAPVDGNAQGSYLTMRSTNGLIFGVVNLIGNFGTVYADQSYWQRAIASQPSTAVKAFSLGGTAWIAIPFGFATTLGLTAVALTSNPDFPGYPSPLTAFEVSAGLPAPAAASALMGQTGAVLLLIVLFLAVVSTSAAEMVAVSGIGTFDVYKRYINPNATGAQILRVNRMCIIGWALLMGIFGLIFFYIGIGMGWLYTAMGTFIGSAVVPIALSIISARANKWGCVIGAWAGLFSGLVAWMVTAATLNDGVVSVTTLGQDYSVLAGNLGALGVGAIIATVSTLIWPEHCDWDVIQARMAANNGEKNVQPSVVVVSSPSPSSEGKLDDKDDVGVSAAVKDSEEGGEQIIAATGESVKSLDKAFRFAAYFSTTLAVILLVLIPLPLFGTSHIFGVRDFTIWVVFGFIWVFYAIAAVVLYPIYESRRELGAMFSSMRSDLMRKRK